MSTTRERSTHPGRRRKQRGRRELVRNALIVLVLAAVLGGLLLGREHLREAQAHGITVVAFEPREADQSERAEEELRAQVALAGTRQDDLMLEAVLDGSDGLIFRTTLACAPGENRLVCEDEQAQRADQVDEAMQALLATEMPGRVSPLAPLRHIAVRLADAEPDRVEVILNLTSRHVGAFDPDGAGVEGRVDEVVDTVEASGVLPSRCDGWRLHVIAPGTGDVREDRALEAVYRHAVESCGGTLARYAERWPVTDRIITLPAPPDLGDDVAVERDPVDESDTFELGDALFDVGSDSLRPDALEVTDGIAHYLESLPPGWRVVVDGYADSTGDEDANQALSRDRARAVAAALLERLEGPTGQITAFGHGSQPDDGTAQSRQANRRVSVVVHHAVNVPRT